MAFRRVGIVRIAALLTAAALAGPALADDDDDAGAAGGVEREAPSILDGVPALSPLKAARDALAEKGLTFSGFYFSDPRGALSGGMRKGVTYSGLLKVAVDADMETIAGIEGGRIHADMLQIHGRDLSEEYIGNIMSVNDIGARPGTRLFEAYYEQAFGDRVSVKLGQLAADEEFITSEYAETFIGATLGWAASPSLNLPQEGPAYPLAALGAQVSWKATKDFTLVAAIYNGYAADRRAEDAELANRHGVSFELGDPPLVIVEGRYAYENGAFGLPGMLKFGGYGHFGRFDDLKRGTDGLVLGAPGSNDDPRKKDGNLNLFALLDQQVWRLPGGAPDQGVGVFVRGIFGAKDRNVIDTYVDGGVVAKGLVPGRPADVAGVAVAYANFSPKLGDVDRALDEGATRKFEAIIEATYKAQIVPGLTVAPTLQYVMRPGGGPPEDGGRRIPNATVFGVTTIVTF